MNDHDHMLDFVTYCASFDHPVLRSLAIFSRLGAAAGELCLSLVVETSQQVKSFLHFALLALCHSNCFREEVISISCPFIAFCCHSLSIFSSKSFDLVNQSNEIFYESLTWLREHHSLQIAVWGIGLFKEPECETVDHWDPFLLFFFSISWKVLPCRGI